MDSQLLVSIWNVIPASAQGYVGALLLLAYLTSHILSNTETPPPNTTYGRFYAIVERLAGIYGQAKDVGIPEPTAQDVLKKLSQHLNSGQPITNEALASILLGGKPNA